MSPFEPSISLDSFFECPPFLSTTSLETTAGKLPASALRARGCIKASRCVTRPPRLLSHRRRSKNAVLQKGMDALLNSLTCLADDELLARIESLAAGERRATAQLIAALAEMERRQLFLPQGCSSLFTYCTQVLHLSESAAYDRMAATRASIRFPEILTRLAAGDVTLTAVRLLIPILTAENVGPLLAQACHRSKRDVEQLVANVRPTAGVATMVRKLPAPSHSPVAPALFVDHVTETTGHTSAPLTPAPASAATAAAASTVGPTSSQRAVVIPLAPDRYRVQFTASRDTYDKLQRARDLLRHVIPDGDPAAVFDRALDALLADLSKKKLAVTGRPRYQSAAAGGTRHIPAAVRREVWTRDAAQCAFVGAAGRCTERGFLELHHVKPFAEGGPASVGNIELRCRAHNAYEASQHCGSFVLREQPPAYHSFRNEWLGWHDNGARLAVGGARVTPRRPAASDVAGRSTKCGCQERCLPGRDRGAP